MILNTHDIVNHVSMPHCKDYGTHLAFRISVSATSIESH